MVFLMNEVKLKKLIKDKILKFNNELSLMESRNEISKELKSNLEYYVVVGFSTIENESLDLYWTYVKNLRLLILSHSSELSNFSQMILLDYVEYLEYKLLKYFEKVKKIYSK